MNMSAIRFKITADGAVSLCTICGDERPVPGGWLELTTIQASARHACNRPGAVRTFGHPATTRFVAERLERADGAYVSMDACRQAWDDWIRGPGNEGPTADWSMFARRLRAALPDGVDVRRCRLDGERQNWIIGMRLRAE